MSDTINATPLCDKIIAGVKNAVEDKTGVTDGVTWTKFANGDLLLRQTVVMDVLREDYIVSGSINNLFSVGTKYHTTQGTAWSWSWRTRSNMSIFTSDDTVYISTSDEGGTGGYTNLSHMLEAEITVVTWSKWK